MKTRTNLFKEIKVLKDDIRAVQMKLQIEQSDHQELQKQYTRLKNLTNRPLLDAFTQILSATGSITSDVARLFAKETF